MTARRVTSGDLASDLLAALTAGVAATLGVAHHSPALLIVAVVFLALAASDVLRLHRQLGPSMNVESSTAAPRRGGVGPTLGVVDRNTGPELRAHSSDSCARLRCATHPSATATEHTEADA